MLAEEKLLIIIASKKRNTIPHIAKANYSFAFINLL